MPDTPHPLHFGLTHEGIEILKSLVGGDPMGGEVKYGLKLVDVPGTFNICLTTNERLRIRIGHDSESWRNRLWNIVWHHLRPIKMIPNFAEVLWEQEGEGIVAWAVRGAALLLSDLKTYGHVKLSQQQQERIDRIIAESVCVREFVRQCVQAQPGSDLSSGELFVQYELWCRCQNIIPIFDKHFFSEVRPILEEELKAKYSTKIQRRNKKGITEVRGYLGIMLNPVWVNRPKKSP